MPTLCCCGNELEPNPSYRVRHSPCRCAKPHSGQRTLIPRNLPDFVTERQMKDRKRLGLPVVTDIEWASERRWV